MHELTYLFFSSVIKSRICLVTIKESSENRNFSHAWTRADTLNSTYWKKDDSSQCAEPDYGPVGVGRLVRRPNGSWNVLFARESAEYFQELIPPQTHALSPLTAALHSQAPSSSLSQILSFSEISDVDFLSRVGDLHITGVTPVKFNQFTQPAAS